MRIFLKSSAMTPLARSLILVCIALCGGHMAMAQTLAPRAYVITPVRANAVTLSLSFLDGGLDFNGAIPITGATGSYQIPALSYYHSFGLFGRSANVTALLPYGAGTFQGAVLGAQHQVHRSGLFDLGLRFSANLKGGPAMSVQDFVDWKQKTLLGASLTVIAPTGQYNPTRLLNWGINRWAFKPELGLSYPIRKFDLDFYVGAWFFTDNPHFFPGNSDRTQDVLPSAQAHISYTFRPSLWCALDSTWYSNGATHLNNGPPTGLQNSSRMGVTLSLPLVKQQSLKIAYSSGVTERVGSNFTTLSVSWQHVWFDRR